MNLRHMANGMPRKIILEKKYNRQINIKMIAIEEAKLIEKQKANYNNWLTLANDRCNSPNYNKVNVDLER